MKTKWELLKETIEERKARNLEFFEKTGYTGAQAAAEEDEVFLYMMDRLEKFMKGLEVGG